MEVGHAVEATPPNENGPQVEPCPLPTQRAWADSQKCACDFHPNQTISAREDRVVAGCDGMNLFAHSKSPSHTYSPRRHGGKAITKDLHKNLDRVARQFFYFKQAG
jgi:hypothetical protein